MLLTLTQVAEQLATDPIHVYRAIARKNLAGNRIGTAGPVRVLDTDLAKYVANSAPDFEMPPLRENWFHPDERNLATLAGQTAGRIRDELATIADATDEPTADVVTIAPNAAIRAIGKSNPRLIVTLKTNRPQPTPFANATEMLMVHTVRAAAKKVAAQINNRMAPLDVLYYDATTYQSIVAQATAQARAQTVSYHRTYAGKVGAASSQSRTVRFDLPLASLIEGNVASYMAKIATLAF